MDKNRLGHSIVHQHFWTVSKLFNLILVASTPGHEAAITQTRLGSLRCRIWFLLHRQSFIHCVSSADLFRLEGPLSVLFNDATALHHCLIRCVTAHQNHTEGSWCVVGGSGAAWLGPRCLEVIDVSRAFIDTCQTIQGLRIFQLRLLLRFPLTSTVQSSLDPLSVNDPWASAVAVRLVQQQHQTQVPFWSQIQATDWSATTVVKTTFATWINRTTANNVARYVS